MSGILFFKIPVIVNILHFIDIFPFASFSFHPECFPVKQKLRRMKPKMSLRIKKEVKKAFSCGALILTNMDSEELPLPVNSDVVK